MPIHRHEMRQSTLGILERTPLVTVLQVEEKKVYVICNINMARSRSIV